MFNKRLVLILAISILMGLTLQQVVPAPTPAVEPTVPCSTTDGLNAPVLAWLKTQGVALKEVVTKYSGEICKGEFDINGTCCDVESIKKFVQTRNNNIIGKWNSFISKLKRIKDKLIKPLEKAAAKLNAGDFNKKIELVKKNAAAAKTLKQATLMIPTTSAEVLKFRSFITSFDSQLKGFRDLGKKCFEVMKKARSNLMCALCSGKAKDFLKSLGNGDFKVKVNSESCDQVVNACFPVWRFNWFIRTAIKYVNINKGAKKGDKAEDKCKSDVVLSEAEVTNLKETFDVCNFNEETKKVECTLPIGSTLKAGDFYKRLCNIGITINKQNGNLEGDESVGDFDDSDTEKIDEEVEPEVKPTEEKKVQMISARLLQSNAVSATASEPTYGVEVNEGGSFNLMTSDNSGVIPPTSLETGQAGEGTSSERILMLSGSVLLIALISFI